MKVIMLIALLFAALSTGATAQSGERLGETANILSLKDCIESVLKQNEDLIKAREKVKEVGGERLMARSRFFPHLAFLGNYDITKDTSDDVEEKRYYGAVRLSQRLLEFGKDTAEDIRLREAQRLAVFNYENKVREVLSNVRRKFFSVLLREQQIEIRQDLLENFREKLRRAQAKREKRMVIPLDVLRAELNVLNEELRINSLMKDQLKRKMELLQLIGKPMGVSVTLKGELKDFEMDPEEAIWIAKENSLGVTLARERVEERARAARKSIWGHLPDLTVQAGVRRGKSTVGMDLSSLGERWALDLSLERTVAEQDSLGSLETISRPDRFASLQLNFPIFDGLETVGTFRMERAKLRAAQAELRNQETLVQLSVRKAYQSLLEAAEARRIQERRVEVSKRRLEIGERLKELGRIGEQEIETFRSQFFRDQDTFFADQDNYIKAQEDLRKIIGLFE